MPVTALDRTQEKQIASGSLLTLDNQIDTTTGTVKLKAIFPNKDYVAFPEPVRERAAAGGDPARCDLGADGRDSTQRARALLCTWSSPIRRRR